ncbi:hypothetical protein HY768_06610 [candidate division TA06 bacterium]|uniref:SRP54-type proteins GTP-binding domain-containing protein n=1 Tax=candidate division TA06 bacterium TaxID=2250710 RepID=A0A933ICL3_UNCT6|nr:hypothetical protein [candidate division TA06 bacterium]
MAHICREAKQEAVKKLVDVLILDTAGRLHIDTEMMAELERVQKTVKPQEILLVVDGMTGQDAVNIAAEFSKSLPLFGPSYHHCLAHRITIGLPIVSCTPDKNQNPLGILNPRPLEFTICFIIRWLISNRFNS